MRIKIANVKSMTFILTLPLDEVCPMAQCMTGVWGGGSQRHHSLVDGYVACHLDQLGHPGRLFQWLFQWTHCKGQHMERYSSFSRRLVLLHINQFHTCNCWNRNVTCRYSFLFHPVSYLCRTSISALQREAFYLLKPQQVYRHFSFLTSLLLKNSHIVFLWFSTLCLNSLSTL